MKSVAAYYVLVAMNTQEQDADRRRAQRIAATRSRPSIIARVRSALGSARASHPAAGPA